MKRHHRVLGLIAATLVACGGNNNMQVDGGTPTGDGGPDAGRADTGATDGGGGTGVCATAMPLTLTAGAHTEMGNTTGHTSGLVDLGAMCGGAAAGEMQAPEVAYAITLPGLASDNVAVSYTLVNAGTDAMFDTTTQVRTDCASSTGATCFDDLSGNDYRSAGTITAPGGSVRYLIVSGYRMPQTGYVNSGPFQIDFTTFVNPTPPTYTSGTATLTDGDDLQISVMGTDAQGAARGIAYSFLDAGGTPIGLDLDGMPTTPAVTDLSANFAPTVTGMNTFTGTVHIISLSDFPEIAANARSLRVTIFSDTGLTSAPEATIPLTIATTVHAGATCDATHVCASGVDCTAGVCVVPAAVVTFCATATPVTIATPTTTTTSATTTINFTTGTGLLEGRCVPAGGMGDEHVLSVVVPAGAFDLLAETPDMGTMGVDTVLYDRTDCGDASTELACNDDRSAMPHVIGSLIEVRNAPAGPHFIVADTFDTQMMAGSADVTIRLRPVLDTGAACDPTQAMNRCATAACPTTGAATCP